MSISLRGQVAVVTGAARGIGRGIAEALAGAGADVVLADLGAADRAVSYELSGRAELDEACRAVEACGVRALGVTCDVTDTAAVESLVAESRAAFDRVDLVVNNAGIVHFAPLEELEEEVWDRVYAVNVKGIFLVSRAFLPALVESRGSMVNIASIAGKRGVANGSLYCSSKFAVVGLTQSLAVELGPRGVRVNAICPGVLPTHMWTHHLASEERGGQAMYEGLVQRAIPLQREQGPEDVAGAVLYLASAPNVTGISLTVAGGLEVW